MRFSTCNDAGKACGSATGAGGRKSSHCWESVIFINISIDILFYIEIHTRRDDIYIKKNQKNMISDSISHDGVTTWVTWSWFGLARRLQVSSSAAAASLQRCWRKCNRCHRSRDHGVMISFYLSYWVTDSRLSRTDIYIMLHAYSLCANLKWYECCMCHFQGGGSASECFRDQALYCYRMRGSFISLQQNHQFVNPVIGWMVRPGEMNLGWCGVELEAGMAGTLWRSFWSEVEIQQGKVTMTGLS